MNTSDVIGRALSTVRSRRECLDLALDRGLGEPMQIERWLLTEMLAQLIRLREKGGIQAAEGEHRYPLKKTSKYEHCDLWWCVNNEEHWLEVKTIVIGRSGTHGTLQDVRDDLAKRTRLRSSDWFHQLVMVFPLDIPGAQSWKQSLTEMCSNYGLALESEWGDLVWLPDRSLLSLLFTLRQDRRPKVWANQSVEPAY